MLEKKIIADFYPYILNDQLEKIELYYNILLKWQTKINLLGKNELKDITVRHFVDCLQILSLIGDCNEENSIVDFGSGNGFPGIVLSIFKQNKIITLTEKNTKKNVFLKNVVKELGLENVRVHDREIEKLATNSNLFVARAFSDIDKTLEFVSIVSRETIGQKNIKKRILTYKGKKIYEEIKQAEQKWCFSYNLYPSIVDVNGFICEVFFNNARA